MLFEVGEVLEAREAGLADASFAAPGVAVFEFGAQQFGQIGAVAEPVAQGRIGQRVGLLADGRQVQGAGGGLDCEQGRLFAQGGVHRAPPANRPS